MENRIGDKLILEYEGNGRWKEVKEDGDGGGVILLIIIALLFFLVFGPLVLTGISIFTKRKMRLVFSSLSILLCVYLIIDYSQKWAFSEFLNSLSNEYPTLFTISIILNFISLCIACLLFYKTYRKLEAESLYVRLCKKYNIPSNGRRIVSCEINGQKLKAGVSVKYLNDCFTIVDMREIGVISYLFLLSTTGQIQKTSFKKFRENQP